MIRPPPNPTQHVATPAPDARLIRAASALWGRVAALRAQIARELSKYEDGRFGVTATNVAYSAELSITDVIGDLHLAEIDRHVRELLEVESALTRITAGTYGSCIDCAQTIDPTRLEFNPHAARCVRCQEHPMYSHGRLAPGTGTL
jgi:DnaK suppressor protein